MRLTTTEGHAMIPQVTLPVPFEQIPAEVERLLAHSRSLQAEVRVCHTLVDAVQESCPHPKNKRQHWTDRSGVGCSSCSHCGKEW